MKKIMFQMTVAISLSTLLPTSILSSEKSGYYEIESLDFNVHDRNLGSPINRVIGEATVVALGEAIHTSGGLHKSIAKIAKYLIKDRGFRAVTIETPWKGAELLNQYVNSCVKGNETSIAEALSGIFPQFRSSELAKLFRFICRYNASNPEEKVTVFGFDMQQWGFGSQPHAFDARAVLDFLQAADEDAAEQFSDGLRVCGGDRGEGNVPGPATAEEYRTCQNTMSELVDHFTENELNYVKMTSRYEVDLVLVSMEVLKFWPRYAFFIAKASQFPQNSPETERLLRQAMNARDHGMASVLVKARKAYAADKKAILIGHTGHFAHKGEELMDFVDKTMGSWLGDYYGESYRVIGSIAKQLETTDWWDNEEIYVPEGDAARHWLEAKLAGLGSEFAFIDAKTNDVITPDVEYILSNGGFGVPADHFDGLLFMVESSAMTPVSE